jgi:hypothetical protein
MTVELVERLIPAQMYTGQSVDIYSGVARISGRIWAREVRIKGSQPRTAVVLNHPTANFLGHYLLDALARTGVAAVGMTTRYIGNDSALLLENCVLDVGAVVARLREEFDNVVLLANSGGGGLTPLYQSQAEKPTITGAPGGGGPDLTRAGLLPADAVMFLNAHPSRALLRTEWLDPAIEDEAAPFDRNTDLDMFNPANGPEYAPDFVTAYRAAQVARNERITAWVLDQLADLETRFGGRLTDLPFVVHGTTADLRYLDATIDPNDRVLGQTFWGPPETANYLPASLAHFTTLQSWLSQWSLEHTNAGVHNVADISAPMLVVVGTADPSVLPCHTQAITDAISHADWERIDIPSGTHYFEGQPELVAEIATVMHRWMDEHDLA